MEGNRLEGNRCYKIFILYLLFMDNLKDFSEPKLVRPSIFPKNGLTLAFDENNTMPSS